MKKSFFQMEGFPIISDLNFEISRNFDFEKIQEIEVEIDVKTGILKKEITRATVQLEVELFPQKQNNNPFYLKATSFASFIWAEGLDEDLIEKMLKINAPSIMLSFIRPIISSITTYAGQPPLIIPLIDFTNKL